MAIGVGAAISLGLGLIDKLFPNPEKRDEARLKLLTLEQQGGLKELDVRMNVIVAEAQSDHFLTATWRPITMLTFVAIIANNYIIAPYLDVLFGTSIKLDIPPDMWGLLKLGLGGYVIGRSGEKAMKTYAEYKKVKTHA